MVASSSLKPWHNGIGKSPVVPAFCCNGKTESSNEDDGSVKIATIGAAKAITTAITSLDQARGMIASNKHTT